MDKPKILAISGSLRKQSKNTILLRQAIEVFGRCSHAMGNLNLPLYNGDLEDEVGLPKEVASLVHQIKECDALIIATPEYNKMIPGVLKNALDWISRHKPQPLAGKPVALISTAGRSGGEVSQITMKQALGSFNTRILQGGAFIVPFSDQAFDSNGKLIDLKHQKALTSLMVRLRQEISLVYGL
jgi:chromate reductase